MSDNQTRLERLPNETFLETFEYLDAVDLFRAFENLSSRFNALLQSLNQLSLTLSPENHRQNFENELFSPSIGTLIVNEEAHVILGHFPNVHHLILHWLPENVIDKLELDIFPDLESLSIDSDRLSSRVVGGYFLNKLFTNGFPQLKFCSLPETKIRLTAVQWRQTPSIKVLKLGEINLAIYIKILSVCPNLRIFEFAIDGQSDIPTDTGHHTNIKTLVIKQMVFKNSILDLCLSCVPNVQRLDIRARDCNIWEVPIWSRSDWFRSVIDFNSPKLRQMNFHLLVGAGPEQSVSGEHILVDLERSFERARTNRYQSRLNITRNILRYGMDCDV